MGEYKTPGVYIKEKNAFGTSVVEAETAIPAFIGITEKAVNGDESLLGKPWKITSMTEFYNYFGGAPELSFSVDIQRFNYLTPQQIKDKKVPVTPLLDPAGDLFVYADRSSKETEKISLKDKNDNAAEEPVPVGYALCVNGKHPYSLYYNMVMFFANGGGACYIVSVGTYDYDNYTGIDDKMVEGALNELKLEREVTMIVVPEAATSERCSNIQQKMMTHCGQMANRIAILDVPQGKLSDPLDTRMENFQNTMTQYLSYGAAYFPWLNTTVLSDKDLTGEMVSFTEDFIKLCNKLSNNPKEKLTEIVKALLTVKKEVRKGGNIDLSAVDSENDDLKSVSYDTLANTVAKYPFLSLVIKDGGSDDEYAVVSGIPKDLKSLS